MAPTVAVEETVPVPLPFVNVRSVVSLLFHVTELVMSSWVLLPGNTALAVKVTVEFKGGDELLTVRLIEVGVP